LTFLSFDVIWNVCWQISHLIREQQRSFRRRQDVRGLTQQVGRIPASEESWYVTIDKIPTDFLQRSKGFTKPVRSFGDERKM
jgi:hypothetical protein